MKIIIQGQYPLNFNTMIEPIINPSEATKSKMSTEESNQTDQVITNQTEMEDIKPMTIGELIQLKRSAKKLTLKTLGQQTKISLSLLENLEANKLTQLPSKAYVTGFVKTLSKILDIDQNEAIAALEYTYNPNYKKNVIANNTVNDQMATQLANQKPEDLKNKESILMLQTYITDHLGLFVKFGAGIAIIGGMGLYITNYINQIPTQKVETAETTITQTTETSAPASETHQAATTTETQNAQPTPINSNVVQPATTSVPPTATTPEATTALVVKPVENVEKKPLKEVNLTTFEQNGAQFEEVDMTTEEYNDFLPARFRVPQQGAVNSVFLNAANGDSWITYKTDENVIKKFVLRQGRTLFMRGELIRLFIGNPDAVKIFYNTAPVKVRKAGKITPRNIVIPEARRVEFKQPLFIFQDDGSAITSNEYETMRASN